MTTDPGGPRLDFKETEQKLLESPIQKIQPIYAYLNIPDRKYNRYAPFILFLKNGLKAVYKPKRSRFQRCSVLMAYRFSEFMEWKFVPPTVQREVNGEENLVRLFIENTNYLKPYILRKLSPVQKSNLYTFYFVLGEHDANKYNVLFEKHSNEIILIDNETCITVPFISYLDYPFRSLGIKDSKLSICSHKDYRNFPLDKIQTLKKREISISYLRKVFYDMEDFDFYDYLIPWIIERADFLEGNLCFVKWKGVYWIKKNFNYYKEIYKNLVPISFSKGMIKKLIKGSEEIPVGCSTTFQYRFKL